MISEQHDKKDNNFASNNRYKEYEEIVHSLFVGIVYL